MSYENLTRNQQDLLRWMVLIAEGRSLGEFRGMKDVTGSSSKIYLIAPDGDERIVELEILSSLHVANLISLTENPKKREAIVVTCSLRELAFEAVRNNFKKPQKEVLNSNPSGVSIGSITVSGGQAIIGEVKNNEIKQIVNNPQLLESQVSELTKQIIDEVKQLLNYEDGITYIKEVNELKEQLLSKKPETPKIKMLISSLGFLGDIEGSLSLMARVWPYLYPLLQIAIQKAML